VDSAAMETSALNKNGPTKAPLMIGPYYEPYNKDRPWSPA
jgi:hypothetical protein